MPKKPRLDTAINEVFGDTKGVKGSTKERRKKRNPLGNLEDRLSPSTSTLIQANQKNEVPETVVFLKTGMPLQGQIPTAILPDVQETSSPLLELLTGFDAAVAPLRQKFQEFVSQLEGKNFESLEANQQVADLIHETATLLHVAFTCPKCSEPARLRCQPSTNSETGVFSFGHPHTTHGGTKKIPPLNVVALSPISEKLQNSVNNS